jgi:hypothetical protein
MVLLKIAQNRAQPIFRQNYNIIYTMIYKKEPKILRHFCNFYKTAQTIANWAKIHPIWSTCLPTAHALGSNPRQGVRFHVCI